VRKKIRVIVVDDEESERKRLVAYLKAEPDVVVVELRGGPETAEALNRLVPDALFLDVQLGQICGFDLLSALDTTSLPKVVLVTASREYAVKAFEFEATDYLLKPVDPARLSETLRRVRTALRRDLDDSNHPVISSIQQLLRGRLGGHSARYLDRLIVHERGRLYFIKVTDIEWLEAEDNYVKVHTGRTSHLIRQTLRQLQEKLDPDQFARIHRSTIVSLDQIREIQLGVGRDRIVVLQSGVHLRLSERYGRQLERRTRGGGALSGQTKDS
jgi:two-component system, LytTR family, response regulator